MAMIGRGGQWTSTAKAPPISAAHQPGPAQGRWLASLLSLALFAMIVVPGCASPDPVPPFELSDAFDAPPEDFAIDLEIRVGRRAPRSGPLSGGVDRRAARYIVLSDGTLHAGPPGPDGQTGTVGEADAGGGSDRLPGTVRRLGPENILALWRLCCDLGVAGADAEAGVPPTTRRTVLPPRDGHAFLLLVRADGVVRSFRSMTLGGALPAEPYPTLTRTLAGLAWWPIDEGAGASVAPRRYDLGPDPYERFRRPAGAP